MIPNLKPYPKYKDSGVTWLGAVPEHWGTKRAKWLFRKMNRPVRESDEVVTCFRDGMVTLRKNRRVRGFTESLKEIGYQGIRRGDLVIHAMDAFAGAIGVADADGKGTPVYLVCEPAPTADSHYYAIAVREMARSQWIQALAKGIRERSTDFRFEEFGSQPVPFPPLFEQTAIVRFLNYYDRKINRFIRKRRRLIELLNEYKQAIINQYVTGKIDPRTGKPYPRYKPSGVDWLGDVPEHWDIKKLKQITRFQNGFAFKPSDWEHEGVPIIRIQNLNGSRNFNYTKRTDIPSIFLVKPGDLLFSWSGNRGTSFGSYIWDRDFPGYLNQHIFKLHGYTCNKTYFVFLLRSVTRYIEDEKTHGIIGLVHVTKPELGSTTVALPPILEQEEIAERLMGESNRIDAALASAQREIALIREFRTRLIADVVTGKVDVRKAAKNLPEEPEEEIEPMEEEAEPEDTTEVSEDKEAAVE